MWMEVPSVHVWPFHYNFNFFYYSKILFPSLTLKFYQEVPVKIYNKAMEMNILIKMSLQQFILNP